MSAAVGASMLYEGWVRHRRRTPVDHDFRYRLSMAYLDLAEVDDVLARSRWWARGRFAPVRYRRADYLGDAARPLDDCVREEVERHLDRRPAGPIRLLTHLRRLGTLFNPVSFYYCFEPDGERLDAIVAEITNTPWKERHRYVLDVAGQGRGEPARVHRFDKDFHVSPFLPMSQRYAWRFTTPDERLVVHMENRDAAEGDGGAAGFDATLVLRRRPLTAATMRGDLVRRPFQTLKVPAAIYLEALRLRLKRCPFHPHPRTGAESRPEAVTP